MTDWKLRVTEPDSEPREIPVAADLTFGRHPDNGCVLGDPRVSSKHARIFDAGKGFLVEDVGSSNKTIVEGGPTLGKGEQLALHPGMKLQLGDTIVEVVGDEVDMAATLVGGPSVDATLVGTVSKPEPKAPVAAPDPKVEAVEKAPKKEGTPKKEEKPAVGEVSAKGVPAKKVPAEKAPADEAPAGKDAPAKKEPAEDAKEAKAAKKPDEKPAKEEPVAEKKAAPAEKEPASEKPASEQPAEAKPVEKKPAAEKPAEEKPAGGSDGEAPAKAKKPKLSDEEKAKLVAEAKAKKAAKAAAAKPDAEKPAAEKPAAEKPAAEKPAAEKPAAEKPAAKPVPAKPADEVETDDASSMGTMATMAGEAAALTGIAREAALKAARPRIVVANDALLATVEVDKDEFVVGRSKRKDPDYVIDHDGVSSRHAKLTFDGKRFFIEDLGSTNGTYIGEEKLAPNSPRQLRGDSRLRFGPIETLFVVDVDEGGNAPDRARQGRALEHLLQTGKITALQRSKAEKDAAADTLHPGALLVAGGLVQPVEWVEAMEAARIARVAETARKSASKPTLWIVIAAIVIAAIVIWALQR